MDQPVPDAGPCSQSYLGYPFLLADALGADLANATCGGATTDHVTTPQPRPSQPWPPQLDAVTADTDLVTVALGYNDFGFYADTMVGCSHAAAGDPAGSPCRDGDTARSGSLSGLPATIGDRVRAVVELVEATAPDATVVVVGYPQLVPESGSCPELPLAAGDYDFVRGLLTDLDAALRGAAGATGVRFVDVMAASEGHDICAGEDAWVAGISPVPGMRAGYHPFASWHEAVADLVLEALER